MKDRTPWLTKEYDAWRTGGRNWSDQEEWICGHKLSKYIDLGENVSNLRAILHTKKPHKNALKLVNSSRDWEHIVVDGKREWLMFPALMLLSKFAKTHKLKTVWVEIEVK